MNKTDGKQVKPEEARDDGYDDKINNLFAGLKGNAHFVSKTVLKKKKGADGVVRTVKEEVKEEVGGENNAMNAEQIAEMQAKEDHEVMDEIEKMMKVI